MTKTEFLPLKDRFEVKNLKKIQAMNMQLWGWMKMPDKIKHYSFDVKTQLVKIPNGLRGYYDFEDEYGEVSTVSHPKLNNEFVGNELDGLQGVALEKMLLKNVGFGHFSTAIGKTMITAKIINKLQVKSLIIVPNLTLMNQMKKDLLEIFGITCKTLSGAKTKQKGAYEDIVIGNIDTVVKQSSNFLGQFDLVILDEADTFLQAERRLEFVGNIAAKYIYGMTGTIQLNHVDSRIFNIYLGDKTELILKHFNPTINKILTSFEYVLDDIKEFHELKKALYENKERNELIMDTIIDNLGNRKGIVFSEYVEHAEYLKGELEKRGIKTFLLIGKVSKEDRNKVRQEIVEHKGACILVGSVRVVGRGFNIPELSIGFLTTCEKFTNNIEQYCGRIIRKFEGKTDAIWYDFVDVGCTLLANQSKSRTRTYKKSFPGCKINLI